MAGLSRAEWERRFQSWSQGPGQTEADRSANAERVIKTCLYDAGLLDKYKVEIILQGSYANRTNIPQESDVDLCVRSMRCFFADYPEGLGPTDFGNGDCHFTFAQYKDDVGRALMNRFRNEVDRTDKCFVVHSNAYRVDADVTPSLEHRRYQWSDHRDRYISGCEFVSDSGKRIVNWPNQHIENGIAKNDAVRRRFKRIVRILKRVQYELIDAGQLTRRLIPSYTIECSVFNAPNDRFLDEAYYLAIRRILAFIFNGTLSEDDCKDWVEVNDLKWLFSSSQPWTREQVHKFADMAWNYVGYE